MVIKCSQVLTSLLKDFIGVTQAHFCSIKHFFLLLILIIEQNSTSHWLGLLTLGCHFVTCGTVSLN